MTATGPRQPTEPRPLAETLPALRRRLQIAEVGEAERQRRRAADAAAVALAGEHGLPYQYVRRALAADVPASDLDAITRFCTAEWEAEASEARANQRAKITADTDSRIPARFARATADHPGILAWVAELARLARRASRNPGMDFIMAGPSVLLVGPVGTGKTYQAYGALRALAAESVSAGWEFTTAADLYGALRPRTGADTETEFRRITRTRLLIIDDLGASKDSEWTEEINYRLINHRYDRELPTLISTNVLPRELPGRLGQRVSSRLAEMTTTVTITGRDRRIHREAA